MSRLWHVLEWVGLSPPTLCPVEKENYCVSFFLSLLSAEVLNLDLLQKAWQQNALHTLRLIFYIRDCRGGLGKRDWFRTAALWMADHHSSTLAKNLHFIPIYGRWDDVLCLPGGFRLFAQQLKKDQQALLDNPSATISLAAKWAPRCQKALDRKYQAVKHLCRELQLEGPTAKARYRKEYLAPLSLHLNTVERKMCAQDWSSIEINKVPKQARKNYAAAFRQHHIRSLPQPDQVVDADWVRCSCVFPHHLLRDYSRGGDLNWSTEEAFRAMIDAQRPAGVFTSCGVVCDVASVLTSSLCCVISSLTQKPYAQKVLLFSERGTSFAWCGLQYASVYEQLHALRQRPKETDMTSGFLVPIWESFLQLAQKETTRRVPVRVLIFTYRPVEQLWKEFDENHIRMKEKYEENNWVLPEIILWDTRHAFSIKSVPGLTFLQGYTEILMQCVLDCQMITAESIMNTTVNSFRYRALLLDE